MEVQFCPEKRTWNASRDGMKTLAEVISESGWNGDHLRIVGGQNGDFLGRSHLFHVEIHRDLAVKFFGDAFVFDAELHDSDEVNVRDMNHLFSWARENQICKWEDLKSAYPEYKKMFPGNCVRSTSLIRISV